WSRSSSLSRCHERSRGIASRSARPAAVWIRVMTISGRAGEFTTTGGATGEVRGEWVVAGMGIGRGSWATSRFGARWPNRKAIPASLGAEQVVCRRADHQAQPGDELDLRARGPDRPDDAQDRFLHHVQAERLVPPRGAAGLGVEAVEVPAVERLDGGALPGRH